jgi:hypothetical protein
MNKYQSFFVIDNNLSHTSHLNKRLCDAVTILYESVKLRKIDELLSIKNSRGDKYDDLSNE